MEIETSKTISYQLISYQEKQRDWPYEASATTVFIRKGANSSKLKLNLKDKKKSSQSLLLIEGFFLMPLINEKEIDYVK